MNWPAIKTAADLELERFVTGPAPYSSGNPVPSAADELAAALEGQAPTLARDVAGLVGPVRTVQLAQAISRAVAVGIRRRGEAVTAEIVAGAHDLLIAGLDQVTDGAADEWVDNQGDVWTLGPDGLMHSYETAPFPREHVEKKWGPLKLKRTADAGAPLVLCGEPVGRWACPHFKPCPNHPAADRGE